MARSPLVRLRTLCLALPEAHEVEAWGEPTFRVKNKLFAMHASPGNHHGGGRPAVWCKAQPLAQDMLVRSFPTRYFKPPYVGPSGWVGVWLDGSDVDWAALVELLTDAWRMTAPKKVAALLVESGGALPAAGGRGERAAPRTAAKSRKAAARKPKTRAPTPTTARNKSAKSVKSSRKSAPRKSAPRK